MSDPSAGSTWVVRHFRHTLSTRGKGTYDLTTAARAVAEAGLTEGTLTAFVRHTSCSLVIMENADPTARRDLHEFFDRSSPRPLLGSPKPAKICEGPDDMPSHNRMAQSGIYLANGLS